MPNSDSTPRVTALVAAHIANMQTERMRALQLSLFPDWPDDRRGAPNTVIRSAVFGVVRRGRRQRVVDMPVAGQHGWSITMTGWRLDQHDCDIWLEVMHLARNEKPGDPVRFTMYSLLKRLGHDSLGKRDYAWIERRLKNLAETTISFENETEVGAIGNLVQAFRIDRKTGEGVAFTNPHIRPLFESITYLNIEQRRALGSNQLAKALHAMIGSHATWMPMKLETLMHRVGATYGRLRDFKRDLKTVLDDFCARGWIYAYRFTAGVDAELLEIEKERTPTQERAVRRLSNK